MADWQSQVDSDTLIARAQLYQSIRRYFQSQSVLEVETPLISNFTVPDLYLESFQLKQEHSNLFLQTSPEYAMKRLLASGSGSIFQICKSFRKSEIGVNHQLEFSMLEWYRVGYDEFDLMDEIEKLLINVINPKIFRRFSYAELFQHHTGIDPHDTSIEELRRYVLTKQPELSETIDSFLKYKQDGLDYIFSQYVEVHFSKDEAVFVYDWPKEQAALARLYQDGFGRHIARRFELYYRKIRRQPI